MNAIWLASLLLLTLPIEAPVTPDAGPLHREAARRLRIGMEAAHAPDLPAEAHFTLLLEAGRSAAKALNGLHAGEAAECIVRDARWRAVLDRDLPREPRAPSVLVHDRTSGEVHSLSPAAAQLLQRCDGRRTLEEVVETVPAPHREAAAQCVRDLAAAGLLHPMPEKALR